MWGIEYIHIYDGCSASKKGGGGKIFAPARRFDGCPPDAPGNGRPFAEGELFRILIFFIG